MPPPPHLSPFADDSDGYIPQQRVVLQRLTEDLKRKEAVEADDEDVAAIGGSEEGESEHEEDDVNLVEAAEAEHQQEILEEIAVNTARKVRKGGGVSERGHYSEISGGSLYGF